MVDTRYLHVIVSQTMFLIVASATKFQADELLFITLLPLIIVHFLQALLRLLVKAAQRFSSASERARKDIN